MNYNDEKLPLNLDRIVFGIRFQPHYELLDYTGTIIDTILRTPESPFSSTVFPYSTRDNDQHLLINRETGDEFRITEREVLLDYTVNSESLDYVLHLAKSFDDYVIKTIRKHIRLDGVWRYGCLFRFAECSDRLRITSITDSIASEFPNIDSTQLRFTRRMPAHESIAKREVNDVRKMIYTFVESDSELFFTLDYQEYFDPELDEPAFKKKEFSQFVSRGSGQVRSEFKNRLNAWILDEEAA